MASLLKHSNSSGVWSNGFVFLPFSRCSSRMRCFIDSFWPQPASSAQSISLFVGLHCSMPLFFAWLLIPKPVNMIRLGFFTTPPLTSSAHSFLLYVFGECRSIGGRSLLALSSGWRKHYGKLCKSLLVISRASLMLPVLVTI